MRAFTIGKNDEGTRVDRFVTKIVPRLPLSLLYKSIRLKRIKLNKKRCEISTRLKEGDLLELYISDEFFSEAITKWPFLSAPKEIDILYEDDNILLVDKKPGLLVHEDDAEQVDTLINRIQHYLYAQGEYNPGKENVFAPALCNRIDRNTGGIVIAAKNAASLRVLNQKIKDRELHKKYLCIVPVSYTHLDVYKRQDLHNPGLQRLTLPSCFQFSPLILRTSLYSSILPELSQCSINFYRSADSLP